MIFESHAHYDDEAFDEDREELLNSMRENGIEYVVNVCAAADGLEKTLELTEKYPFVYGAVGVHPDDAGKMNEEILQRIQEYCGWTKWWLWGKSGWTIIGINKAMRFKRNGSNLRGKWPGLRGFHSSFTAEQRRRIL